MPAGGAMPSGSRRLRGLTQFAQSQLEHQEKSLVGVIETEFPQLLKLTKAVTQGVRVDIKAASRLPHVAESCEVGAQGF